MKTRVAISLLVLGTVAFAGCGGASGSDGSALPDCRSYRAAISRAFEDPESTVTPTGLSPEDKQGVMTDRLSFQKDLATHAEQIAAQQSAHDAALTTGGTSISDIVARAPVTDDRVQYRQRQLTKWQAYVDQEIPRILSRQGCS